MSTSSRPAVPSRSASPELVGLVDRYRRAASSSVSGSDRSSLQPILDRYGRSGRTGRGLSSGTFTPAPRRSGARELNAERYARGPEMRRSLTGVSAPSSAPSRAAVLRSATTSRRAAQKLASVSPDVDRASGLNQLASRDPQAARRIYAAGDALANSTALGLAAGVSVTSGGAAGSLVLGATRSPASSKSWESCYWGYGYYPWWSSGGGSSWWFGYGWGYGGWGCGPSWAWAPLWTACWYPYYSYSYNYCYPYYCKPSYYYPFYYSTVVHHVYEDDPIVVVVDDGDDDVIYVDAPQDEPVGEAVAASRPVDSPLMQSLSIAAERYLTLGDRAFREGRFSDAAQFYAKAVEYAPTEGVMHLVLADALFATADYHYAAYALRRAFELSPSLALAIVDKHEFYADPADFDRHLAAAETFVANNPDDADARLVLAANFLFGNRPAAAVDLLERHAALSLRADTAAGLILDAAREIQHGLPAPTATEPVEQQ